MKFTIVAMLLAFSLNALADKHEHKDGSKKKHADHKGHDHKKKAKKSASKHDHKDHKHDEKEDSASH